MKYALLVKIDWRPKMPGNIINNTNIEEQELILDWGFMTKKLHDKDRVYISSGIIRKNILWRLITTQGSFGIFKMEKIPPPPNKTA